MKAHKAMLKKISAFLLGWLAGLATVLVLFRLADRASTIMLIAIFLAAGFLIGCCAGLPRWLAARIGTFAWASLTGVLTGALPVIVVSYGFALVWLPVVVPWCATVVFGMRTARAWRRPVLEEA